MNNPDTALLAVSTMQREGLTTTDRNARMLFDTIVSACAPREVVLLDARPEAVPSFPISIRPDDADPLFSAVLREMEAKPHFIKLAIYPDVKSAYWQAFDGINGEDLDQLDDDACDALDANPSPTRASYLKAARAAIDGFKQKRREWL